MTSPGVPGGSIQTNELVLPPQSQRTNRLAIAALICGLPFIFWPAAIVAIILGHIARREIRRTGEHGIGLATAGLILGYVGLALSAFLFVVPAVLFMLPYGTVPLVLVVLFGVPGCAIATMITLMYRQRRRRGRQLHED